MYRAKIFGALIVLISLVSFAETKSKASVFEQFKSEISELKKTLSKEKSAETRMALIDKSVSKIKELRGKNPRQSEEQEINMSLYLDTLANLPAKKEFKFNECEKYQSNVKSMMTSYTDQTKEVYIEEAFEVVKLLCRK